jgi:hypothetical protein
MLPFSVTTNSLSYKNKTGKTYKIKKKTGNEISIIQSDTKIEIIKKFNPTIAL